MYVMPTEPKELLLKWIAALESGKYKQTKRYLQTEEGFCCLGVLCNEIDPSQWSSWRVGDDNVRIKSYDAKETMVPDHVCFQLPFIPSIPSTSYQEVGWNRLMAMNDSEGKTFEEIAKYLRKTYSGKDNKFFSHVYNKRRQK